MRNGRRSIRASISRMSIQLTSYWWAKPSVLGVVLAASCPALQGAPLTQFGVCVCVFDGDPPGGLAALGLPPAVLFGDRSFAEVLRLAGRSAHLVGELVGKSPVAFVDLGFHTWVGPEMFSDALGAHRGLIVHPARPHRPAPQGASLAVADGGGLDRVLLALAGDESGPSGASGPRPTDLGFGAVDAQCDVFGLVSWPSAGLAPPVAAAPLAAPGLASRLPPRREFGDKLAKVFP